MSPSPSIAVVVSTRNRGDGIVPTLRTILANDYEDFTLVVIDQSENDATDVAVRPFLADPRLRYVRTATKGLSISRNLGVENSAGELIAITDDDCELPADWVRQVARAFALDERIGVVFGKVLPGPHDSAVGFVPSYLVDTPSLARRISEKNKVQGVGACMAVRRSLWQALGGFDPLLSVGAPRKAGEETDLTIRALLAGAFVFETPDITLVHHGFYTWEERGRLIEGYWYGTGAAFGKSFRGHPFAMTDILFRLASRWLSGRSPMTSSLGEQPRKWLQLSAFARGFALGALFPAGRAGK